MSSDGTSDFQASAASVSFFVKWMATGVALLNLLVLGMVAFSLYKSFNEFQEHAAVTAQNLSVVLAQNISGDIDKVDLSLLAAKDEVERRIASGKPDSGEITALLGRLQGRIPHVAALRTTDANGLALYGLGVPSAPRVDLSDRDYFIRLRDDPHAGLVISQPIFGRITKGWGLIFARRLNYPDGRFAGVVYTRINLVNFQHMFSSLDVGSQGAISLRDGGMGLIVRFPTPADIAASIGDKTISPEFHRMLESGKESGVFYTPTSYDNTARVVSFRKAGNYPLYVSVGLAEENYLLDWRKETFQLCGLAALFILLSAGASRLIARAWRLQLSVTKKLAREEEKFHTVADYTYDWEYWEGANHEILYMSQSCERVTGYAQSEFMADPGLLYSIIHPDDVHLMEIHRKDAAHEDVGGADFRIVRRDGEIRWIAHGCSPVFGRDGKFMGRRASNRDITERKRAEAAVLKLNAELEQRVAHRTAQLEASNKELEEFSYSMSHDMRTPLRALDGFSKILLEEHGTGLDDEGKRMLKVLRDNAQRMGRLVDDILGFLSWGRRRMQFGSVDIAKLALEIFTELQGTTPAPRLRLVIGALPPAWGDRDMIREVLQHLLSNAVKFSLPEGEALIEVGGTTKEGENCYHVKDYGVGFDMRYADKLFKVFERVHPTGRYEGSAIGLAIVKRIVTRHGGRVWAEGKVNGGATFYFSIPVPASIPKDTQWPV